MRRLLLLIVGAVCIASAAAATNQSTIDPTVPADGSDIDADVLRENFQAAHDDVNSLWQVVGEGAGFTAQQPNTVLAGPASGSSAVPAFRFLTGGDLPTPGPSSLGGVRALAPTANFFINGIGNDGIPVTARPSCSVLSDAGAACSASVGTSGNTIPLLSGNNTWGGSNNFIGPFLLNGTALAASATTDTTNASNITSGTLSNGRLTPLLGDQVLGSTSAGSPSGMSIPSCSSSASGLTYTLGTGFGCNSAIAPAGAAGGDLAGNFPNPTVKSVGDVNSGVLLAANGGTGATSIGTGLSNAGGVLVATGAAAQLYVPNLNIASSQQLYKWRGALGNVLSGTSDAKILVVGDSTSVNETVAIPAELEASGVPVNIENFIGNSASGGGRAVGNARLATGSWTEDTTTGDQTLGGNIIYATGTTASPLTFTPATPTDTINFWYEQFPGGDTFSYSLDGGSPVNVNTNGTAAMPEITISTTLGMHKLSLSWVSGAGNGAKLTSFEGRDSTRKYVYVENAGWGQSRSDNWNVSTNPWSPNASAAINAYAPNLVIIELCVNDWIQGTGASACGSNVAAMVANYQAAGADVIVMTGPPGTNTAGQQPYVTALNSVATAANVPFVDNWSTFNPYASSLAAGLLAGDGIHQSQSGAFDEMRNLFPLIMPGAGNGVTMNSHGRSFIDYGGSNVGLHAPWRGQWGLAMGMDPQTYIDTTTALNTVQSQPTFVSAFGQPTLGTNYNNYITYTNSATVGIAGPPLAGTAMTLTHPYSLYISTGDTYFGGNIVLGNQTTPSHTATCVAGTMWADQNYIYVCAISGTVKRAALSTF